MHVFQYKAVDNSGAQTSGIIESESESAALATLKKQGLHVVEIKVSKESFRLFNKNKISLSDLEFLTSELSLLLKSGVKIDKGIDIIRKSKSNLALAQLLAALSRDLKKGKPLSQSFREHSDIFDDLYCNLIELGEATGDLAGVFDSLARDLKFKRDLQAKVIGSLAYPAVILFVCLLSIFFIFNVIIPKMSTMFEDPSVLPWYTQMMLEISDFFVNYQLFMLLALLCIPIAINAIRSKPSVIAWWHKFSLRIPLLSKGIKTVELIRFNSGLAMMLKAGVQLDKALALSSGSIRNNVLRREVEIARKQIKQGEMLSVALKKTSIYPEFFVSLLEVGEESGNLDTVFAEIADRTRRDFSDWTAKVTNLLEPMMILFMGGFVGSVVVIMLLSMVSVNDIGF
ncbi:type II secretion system protein [Pseudoalteromonas luteoviolacea B = ATCC 29581]|nr:type II secretion system protein [Pseudoalteromonas luteoviolacea B = ATCC 29581]